MTPVKQEFNVVIIGGGPAGMASALWCSELGLNAVLFDKEDHLGGQLTIIHNPIRNYLGIDASNGSELLERFLRSLKDSRFELQTAAAIEKVDLVRRKLVLAEGAEYSGTAIVVATGVRRRTLGVPGEAEFRGKGILRSGAESKDEIVGKTVVIVGGGDAAFENALMLSEKAKKVFVVHRRDEFSAREEFFRNARGKANIEFVLNSRVREIAGNTTVTAVDVQDTLSGTVSRVDTDAVLIRIGVEPNNEVFREQLACDAKGYILVDNRCRTSVENVYAVGDIASPVSPTISTAVGMAATAVKAIKRRLSGSE
jgi:thioredoxin reductase (NADPH)